MGSPNPPGRGVPTYDFAKFSQKMHEIELIGTLGAHPSHPPSYPPMVFVVLCARKKNVIKKSKAKTHRTPSPEQTKKHD